MKIINNDWGRYSKFFWNFWRVGYISEPVRHGDGVRRFEVEIYDPQQRQAAEVELLRLGLKISHRNELSPARFYVEFTAEGQE